jgi:hypothetical protein
LAVARFEAALTKDDGRHTVVALTVTTHQEDEPVNTALEMRLADGLPLTVVVTSTMSRARMDRVIKLHRFDLSPVLERTLGIVASSPWFTIDVVRMTAEPPTVDTRADTAYRVLTLEHARQLLDFYERHFAQRGDLAYLINRYAAKPDSLLNRKLNPIEVVVGPRLESDRQFFRDRLRLHTAYLLHVLYDLSPADEVGEGIFKALRLFGGDIPDVRPALPLASAYRLLSTDDIALLDRALGDDDLTVADARSAIVVLTRLHDEVKREVAAAAR